MKVENRGSIVLVFRSALMAQALRLHELSSCGAFGQLLEASKRQQSRRRSVAQARLYRTNLNRKLLTIFAKESRQQEKKKE
jgi:hypothetical protein